MTQIMKTSHLLVAVTALAVCLLLASLALNAALFAQATSAYRDESLVRLDPFGVQAFHDAAQPNRAAGDRLIVLFGDSRAQDWPAPARPGFVTINRGIGNQTSAQVLGRFDEHVRPLHPDVLVLQVGINDLKAIGVLPQRRDDIRAQLKAGIAQIVAEARAAGISVIVLTTVIPSTSEVPLPRRAVWSPDIDTTVEQINDDVRKMAAKDVIVLDAAQRVSDGQGHLRRDYAVDLLHLNAAGYGVLSEDLQHALDALGR